MAILTAFSTTTWNITLSRVETESESVLAVADLTVTGNTVTALSGTGLTRLLTLGTAVETLNPSDITIASHTGMTVVSTANAESLTLINQVRERITTDLTSQGLPDSIITSDVYLGMAELGVLGDLGLTEAQYESRAATDSEFKRRVRLAVIYRTAAELLYSVPQILRESLLSDSRQYSEVDWEKKREQLLSLSKTLVTPYEPTTGSTSVGESKVVRYERYTAF